MLCRAAPFVPSVPRVLTNGEPIAAFCRGHGGTRGCETLQGDLMALRGVLSPFTAQQVSTSRRALRRLELDPEGFTKVHMYTLRKVLQRLPRHVTTLRDQR